MSMMIITDDLILLLENSGLQAASLTGHEVRVRCHDQGHFVMWQLGEREPPTLGYVDYCPTNHCRSMTQLHEIIMTLTFDLDQI